MILHVLLLADYKASFDKLTHFVQGLDQHKLLRLDLAAREKKQKLKKVSVIKINM